MVIITVGDNEANINTNKSNTAQPKKDCIHSICQNPTLTCLMCAETYILLRNNISKERSRHLCWLELNSFSLDRSLARSVCPVKPLESFNVDIFTVPVCRSHIDQPTTLTHTLFLSLALALRKIPRISCEHGKSTNSMKNQSYNSCFLFISLLSLCRKTQVTSRIFSYLDEKKKKISNKTTTNNTFFFLFDTLV